MIEIFRRSSPIFPLPCPGAGSSVKEKDFYGTLSESRQDHVSGEAQGRKGISYRGGLMEKKDILIVDDMEINRAILSQIFADRNQILEGGKRS